eukprot:gene11591-4834_t
MIRKLFILTIVIALAILVKFTSTQTHHNPNIKPEDKMEGVIEITSEKHGHEIFQGKLPTFVFVYRKSCVHSKLSAPYFSRVARKINESKFSDLIQIAKVDADAQYRVAQYQLTIHGTPSLILVLDHKENHGVISYQMKEYHGDKSLDHMIEFLERYTVLDFEKGEPNFEHSLELTESTFNEVIMKKEEDVFVHFYTTWDDHSKEIFNELEKAAYLLRNTKYVTLTKIDVTNANEIKKKYQLEGFPRFILFPAFNKRDRHFYSGNRKADSFVQFINMNRGVRPAQMPYVHHPEPTKDEL